MNSNLPIAKTIWRCLTNVAESKWKCANTRRISSDPMSNLEHWVTPKRGHHRPETQTDPINPISLSYVDDHSSRILHTFICGFPDDEFRVTAVVDTTDVHMSSVLSISSCVGRGLSEQGDCSRDVESRSSSLKGRPVVKAECGYRIWCWYSNDTFC